MKVVIDGRMITYTGIGRYIQSLLAELPRTAPENSYAVIAGAGSANGSNGANAHAGSNGANGSNGHLDLDGVEVLRPWLGIPVYSLREHLFLPLEVLRQRADVVHYPNFNIPAVAGRPVVTTIHDIYYYLNPRACPGPAGRLYARLMLRRAVKASTRIIAVSEYAASEIITHLGADPERVAVIPNGVSPIYAPVEEPAKRAEVLARYGIRTPYIFYAGSHHGRKNIERLIEAYAKVAGRHEVGLVIAGKKDARQERIYMRVEDSGLASRIRFIGEVPEPDLPVLYSAAEVFLFPSLYEGFGLPLIEAMASGTPVVTSNRASIPEVVGSAAVQIDPEDTTAMAEAVCGVLENPELRAGYRERGIKRAALFTWQKSAEKTLAVYEEAAREGR